MEMISSTWRCEPLGRLIGCGADVETVDRFRKISDDNGHPMPFVFTQNELQHARRYPDPARTLTVCFSCKEAVRKVLDRPYNYTECESFPIFNIHAPNNSYDGPLRLDASLRASTGITAGRFRTASLVCAPTEQWTAVLIFGGAVS